MYVDLASSPCLVVLFVAKLVVVLMFELELVFDVGANLVVVLMFEFGWCRIFMLVWYCLVMPAANGWPGSKYCEQMANGWEQMLAHSIGV